MAKKETKLESGVAPVGRFGPTGVPTALEVRSNATLDAKTALKHRSQAPAGDRISPKLHFAACQTAASVGRESHVCG